MKTKKVYIFLFLAIIITLLAWCPWVNEKSANDAANKQVGGFLQYPAGNSKVVVRKIPFGALVSGDVSAGSILPAFSNRTYYVSPIFTVHLVN